MVPDVTAVDQGAADRIKLRVRGLTKIYGEVMALHPTDLDLAEGEFLTLLGPSGSGKTTLLMMVAGLQLPDGGELMIDGVASTYLPTAQRDIGMVFQSYALFPHLSVFENIAFPLRMRRMPAADIRREVMRVLEIVSLGHVADRLPRALSGGQQQRIALARAIVYRPSIVLMDEPLSALDRKLREQLQDEIRSIHRQLGTTILFVTHDQGEALAMSDRICVMSHGRIEQSGSPEEVYARPANMFCANFLGESNIVEGIAKGSDASGTSFEVPLFGGAHLRVRSAAMPTGTRAKIMLRPEHLRFSQEQSAASGAAVTIAERSFGGSSFRYTLKTDGGANLTMLCLNGAAPVGADIGDRAFVAWDDDKAVVIPDAVS